MRRQHRIHEPHLALRQLVIPAGGEWTPRSSGWTLIQIRDGSGYFLQPNLNQQMDPGAVLVVATGLRAIVRASNLGDVSIDYFNVVPKHLGGLLTLNEQGYFQGTLNEKPAPFQLLSAEHPVAANLRTLCAHSNQSGLSFRLKLLQAFVEAFGVEPGGSVADQTNSDAKERLRNFLQATSSSELLEMGVNELAQRTHCTPRHLSRVFRELVGMSFQNKRSELRLARARELLASSDSKIVDVALESGFKSLSLFNLMFSRHFGSTPGRWRLENVGKRVKTSGGRVRLL